VAEASKAKPHANQPKSSCGSCSGIEDMIAEAEGKRTCMHHDSLGIPTIGIGFNLKRSDAPSLINGVGANYNKVLAGSECLNNN